MIKKKVHTLSTIGMCTFLLCSCSFDYFKSLFIKDPKDDLCEHSLRYIKEKKPSFYEDGNSDYYVCEKCSKTFNMSKEEIDSSKIKTRLEIFNKLDQEEPMTLYGRSLKLEYSKENFDKLISKADNLLEKINKKNYTAIEANNLINEILNEIDFLGEQYDIAYVLADAKASSSDYELKNEIYSAYYSAEDKYYEIYVAIAKEGSYNHLFFKNKTQEQIDAFIEEHSPSTGGSGKETTTQKIEKLLNNYKAGKIERYPAFHDYIELSHQLAEEKSYPSYLEYSYKNYSREYTVNDAKILSEYATNYLTPLFQNINEKLEALKTNTNALQAANKMERKFFGRNINLLRDYAKFLGGDYKENFKNFFDSGDYFFSAIKNSNATAYTASSQTMGSYIFMSRDYQSLPTFVHEFGHYNAGKSFGPVNSLDLSETQSQGNEMLFLSYLNNESVTDETVSKIYTYSQLSDTLNTILLGCAVNEIEEYAYKEEFDQNTFENKWLEIVDKYGASITRDKLDYLYQVILNYRGYYISYAVSGIASLELFAKCYNNLEQGIDAYKSIFKKDSLDEKFKKSLQNANLFDIFSEDAYLLIQSLNEF